MTVGGTGGQSASGSGVTTGAGAPSALFTPRHTTAIFWGRSKVRIGTGLGVDEQLTPVTTTTPVASNSAVSPAKPKTLAARIGHDPFGGVGRPSVNTTFSYV